ncbi:GAF domain-containing protein [Roseospira goensis]|uniref:GAF domain-containing protein n=1 Tax=Roseospira goensis TaxID=391922 RepID=A0A7W6WKP2_9PROT|nr:GAF domain-containing protein [Roseospira goensis]MBB4285989.1 hypothetical protein [Roseospira goensis]
MDRARATDRDRTATPPGGDDAVLPRLGRRFDVLPDLRHMMRWVAVLETGLFLGVVLALDLLVFDGTRFRDVAPHPFWLPVLFIALRYGSTEALVTVAACTAALLIGNMPPQHIDQDVFAYTFAVARLPLLWLVVGVLVGELRNRQIAERDQLRDRVRALETQAATLTDAYEAQSRVNEALEVRVAGQLRTVLSTYEAARAMERLGRQDVLEGIAALVQTLLAPEKFSVFLLEEGGGLRAAVTEGWAEGDRYPRAYGLESLLYQDIVGRRRVLCAADRDDASVSQHGLLAGPLVNARSGETVGMLKIEAMPFLDFNPGLVDNFRAVCDWIGTAYANASLYEAARDQSVLNPEVNLLTASFLERQSRFLVTLADRIGFPVTEITLRVEGRKAAAPAEAARIGRALSACVEEALRTTDLAFDRRNADDSYVLLLPNTPLDGAEVVAGKLRESLAPQLADLDPDLRLSIAVVSLHDPGTDPA